MYGTCIKFAVTCNIAYKCIRNRARDWRLPAKRADYCTTGAAFGKGKFILEVRGTFCIVQNLVVLYYLRCTMRITGRNGHGSAERMFRNYNNIWHGLRSPLVQTKILTANMGARDTKSHYGNTHNLQAKLLSFSMEWTTTASMPPRTPL